MKKILIIEDDPELRKALMLSVKQWGYLGLEAKDGKIGTELFEKEQPDLVVLDLAIPFRTGIEVLNDIRIKLGSEVPVIILTNSEDTGDKAAVEIMGTNRYLLKVNTPLENIKSEIEALLQQS
ncbi:response regulator transcription factor [candidate division WWE3 bacterium]|nr:response regulator transcription factor [candidate division WWE3 bacterium]